MSNDPRDDAYSAAQSLIILEPGIVSRLAEIGLSDFELEGLDSLNNRLKELAIHGDCAEWAMLDRYFHIKLSNSLPYEEVRLLSCSLLNRVNRQVKAHGRTPNELSHSVDEHRAVIDCIRRRDSTAAAELLRTHRLRAIEDGWY